MNGARTGVCSILFRPRYLRPAGDRHCRGEGCAEALDTLFNVENFGLLPFVWSLDEHGDARHETISLNQIWGAEITIREFV